MKLGLLGTGNWGKHYVRLLPEYGELIIMDREIDPIVDCVIIATPAETHFEYIKKALEADKHILVEKPMVMSLDEALEVKKILRDKVFMVGHQYIFNDSLPKIKLKKLEVKMRYPVKNAYWEASPHIFSILDLLYEGDVEVIIDIKKGKKYRKFLFNGQEWVDNPTKEPLKVELEHFIDCVKNNKKPLTDIEHSIRVIKLMEYAKQ